MQVKRCLPRNLIIGTNDEIIKEYLSDYCIEKIYVVQRMTSYKYHINTKRIAKNQLLLVAEITFSMTRQILAT